MECEKTVNFLVLTNWLLSSRALLRKSSLCYHWGSLSFQILLLGAAQMWHLSLQCNRIGEEKTNRFKCEGKHWFFCVLPVPPPPGMNCNWIDTWCCSWQEWVFIEGRLHDKLWKGAGSFVARFLAPQMIFRVPGADCQPGDSRAAWQSRVRSSPGLQRVLCRHVSWPSLDLLLLPSLAKFAGGF